MTVESNDATAITTLSGWLESLAAFFQPMGSKTKTNGILYRRFFLRIKKVTGNC